MSLTEFRRLRQKTGRVLNPLVFGTAVHRLTKQHFREKDVDSIRFERVGGGSQSKAGEEKRGRRVVVESQMDLVMAWG